MRGKPADSVSRPAALITAGITIALLLQPCTGAAQDKQPESSAASAAETAVPIPADLLSRAFQSIQSGQAEEAWRLLEPYEVPLAGDTRFDYLLGIAALDSGRPHEAVLILERVVQTAPDYAGARMELARAYFDAGDNERARVQFERLSTESPPPAASEAITNYLSTINYRAAAYETLWTPYVSLTGGYDTNANASTNEQIFLGFTLSERNVETESSFIAGVAGTHLTHPIKPNTALVANIELGHRYNPDAAFVDNTIGRGYVGINHEFGANVFKVAVGGHYSLLDGDYNESGAALDVELSRSVTDNWVLTGVARGGLVRFDDNIDVMDVDRLLVAFRALHRSSGAQQGIFSFSLIGGQDNEVQAGSPYGNTRWGSRVGGSWSPSIQHRISLDAGVLITDYDGQFFGMDREDTQVTAGVAWSWQSRPGEGVNLNPYIRYVNNDSDIDLYQYDRVEGVLTLLWEF